MEYFRNLDFIEGPGRAKARQAFNFWKKRKIQEGTLSNNRYEYFYTVHFGLDRAFYEDRKILDVGCGPRGSLEWADMACERVGLDPLADNYRKLGTGKHKMIYVTACAEQIPYPDGYFDIVSSFNSLDHVDNLEQSINEIIRVIAPGGLFLLLTDLEHPSTVWHPQVYSWDILKRFFPSLKVIEERHYEKPIEGIYESILTGVSYNHADKMPHRGILSAKLIKMA